MHKCHFLGCFWGLAGKKILLRKRERQTTTKPKLTLKFSHIPSSWIGENPRTAFTILMVVFWYIHIIYGFFLQSSFHTHAIRADWSLAFSHAQAQTGPSFPAQETTAQHPHCPQGQQGSAQSLQKAPEMVTLSKGFYYKIKASQLGSPTSQNLNWKRSTSIIQSNSWLCTRELQEPQHMLRFQTNKPQQHPQIQKKNKQLFPKVWIRTCPALPSGGRGSRGCKAALSPVLSPTAEHTERHVLKCKPDIFLGDFVRHITLLYYYRELSKQPGGKALPQTCTSINCHSIK